MFVVNMYKISREDILSRSYTAVSKMIGFRVETTFNSLQGKTSLFK